MENYKDKNSIELFKQISSEKNWREDSLNKILRKFKDKKGIILRNDQLVVEYNNLIKEGLLKEERIVKERIRLRPTRTNSGVAVVTVLTKPFPCPGKCIYCPNDECMPKSYISSEPGAQRALASKFDPYAQVFNRLVALKNIGHNIEKVELIILGGTWSVYFEDYQLWFVNQCYMGLNDVLSNTTRYVDPRENSFEETSWEELEKNQIINEDAYCRNVGLVFETRPDYITEDEVIHMRRLGATKVQIGIQSLSDDILEKNEVGRTVEDTRKAFILLRRAGFKIHGHWMPNLYGSTVENDILDYKKLWDEDFSPDELKIYPTSVIPNTKLSMLYEEGKHIPYTEEELIKVLVETIPHTPKYCRLSRVIRDIPSNEIVAGNKKTNLRQIVENELRKKGVKLNDIRSREIKNESIELKDIEIEELEYKTTISKEFFISYKTIDTDKICGFIRLSVPKKEFLNDHFISELKECSIIREVHVYGKVVGIKDGSIGESQHLGLGISLVEVAENISRKNNIKKIAVISAIGTRRYYEKLGYIKSGLYMVKTLL
ncbi:MAG: elongator complex protein 3 [Candidatus Dojkabacteria bacterium]